MEPFFNDTLKMQDIADAWKARKIRLRQEELQTYSNAMFREIYNRVMSRRSVIHAELKEAASNAQNPSEVSTVLWSYNQVIFKSMSRDYDSQMDVLRSRGLDHVIICPTDPTKYVSVHEIIRKTNILSRLSEMFGYCFAVRDKDNGIDVRAEDWDSRHHDLVLTYCPAAAPPSPPVRNLNAEFEEEDCDCCPHC